MPTAQEHQTSGIALGSPRPSRDRSPDEGARLSVKQLRCTRDLFALYRGPDLPPWLARTPQAPSKSAHDNWRSPVPCGAEEGRERTKLIYNKLYILATENAKNAKRTHYVIENTEEDFHRTQIIPRRLCHTRRLAATQ